MDGLSTFVSTDVIKEKNYDLMPAVYVKEKMKEESMTIEEIDEELAKLYAQLGVK
jgi:type I restriction-modification system DNA methylase subunit